MKGITGKAICTDSIHRLQALKKKKAIFPNPLIRNSCRRCLSLLLITTVAIPTVAAAVDLETGTTIEAPASSGMQTNRHAIDSPQSTEAKPTVMKRRATELGQVVVTAEHVQSTESKTPIAMDVIDGDQLNKQALVTVADLNGYAQNLNVQENYNGVQFTIRGVTNGNGSTLNDPAVAFMLDGIYIPRQTTPMYLGFYDIDRVEVLRGPQGTLWGRNTTAGVVNVITNSPDLTSTAYSGSASVGNYSTTQYQFMANVPVTNNFAVRAAVSYDRRDSYLNKTPGDPYSLNPAKGDLAGRVSALWNINDDITLNLKADYANVDNVFFGSVPVTNFYHHPTTTDPIYNSMNSIYYDGGTKEQLSLNGLRQYWQGGTHAHTWGVTPQLDWDLGPLKMTYLSSFRALSEHYKYAVPLAPTYAMPNLYVSSDQATSQELRFSTQGLSSLQAQFGLYYFHEALYDNWSIYDFPNVFHFGYLAVGSDPQVNTSRAAFAQATYSLMPSLRFTAGLRESHDEKSYFSQSVRNAQPYSDPATNVSTPSFATISDSKLTWRTGIEYDLLDHTMLYGTVSTGYKAGGVNSGCLQGTSRNGLACTGALAVPASILFYQPETLTSYEVGIKSLFADDTVYVTLDGFRYKYDNLQLGTLQSVSGLLIEATTNAANASVNGIEFNGTWRPDHNSTFSLGVTYLNAKYENYFPLGQIYPINYKGRTLDDSPKYTANLGYTYTHPTSSGGRVDLGVHTYFSNSYILSDVAVPVQYRQPDFHITDINATYTFPRGEWYVGMYARNLENKIIVINANPNAVVPGAPRTFGLRVGFNF
ncbi:MAG: TonB-dependent receptor [Rhodanobacter sp.]